MRNLLTRMPAVSWWARTVMGSMGTSDKTTVLPRPAHKEDKPQDLITASHGPSWRSRESISNRRTFGQRDVRTSVS